MNLIELTDNEILLINGGDQAEKDGSYQFGYKVGHLLTRMVEVAGALLLPWV